MDASLQVPQRKLYARAGALLGGILVTCIVCHLLALACATKHAALSSSATLSFILGLRHAVDCDHLAAIDNVTRQMLQHGQQPVSVGFWFALGHSTIVLIFTVSVASGYSWIYNSVQQGDSFAMVAQTFAGLLSALLIFLVGLMNANVAIGLFKQWWQLSSKTQVEQDAALEDEARQGLRTALSSVPCLQRVFTMVDEPAKMFYVGFLFGLSFDSATQVGLLGLAAIAAAHAKEILWMVLLLPLSFSCGMCLVDTANGLLMLATYQRATVQPLEKLVYNLLVTSMSAFVAMAIAVLEFLQMYGDQTGQEGRLWDLLRSVNMATVGYGIIGTFLVVFLLSLCLGRSSKSATKWTQAQEPLLAA